MRACCVGYLGFSRLKVGRLGVLRTLEAVGSVSSFE